MLTVCQALWPSREKPLTLQTPRPSLWSSEATSKAHAAEPGPHRKTSCMWMLRQTLRSMWLL